ncbi:GNAT family N-acetyltransferase [Govanella unica]|uniref:L-ornithine N(alpha)-acyltransferase n=1 Tax=Govanella unica TaxID=2975056 RepID=A0A9X3Z807_9PROT|nr:GNAT family N-acyltransferase [Govania unica]MDA5194671.1 GNAT family N-acetyltransferase [Govania unica]
MSYPILHSHVKTATDLQSASSFAEVGALEVRLAVSEAEIRAAQALRYKIFYEELGATPTEEMARERRDFDRFDELADHLLVVDRTKQGIDSIVGTYRLLRETVIGGIEGFYSNQEFDLSPLVSDSFRRTMMPGRQLLELGRSCVDVAYRTNSTIHLLWRGIAIYTLTYNIGYMFGCASLKGIDTQAHAQALSYLHHDYSIPESFRVRAQPHRFHDMNMIPREELDMRLARRALPPLVKGYLRLGCYIGNGAVVDEQWDSTDVFILLPVERITHRYSQHFELNDMGVGEIVDAFTDNDTLRII